MWIEKFRQYLNETFQRLAAWAQAGDSWPARLIQRKISALAVLPPGDGRSAIISYHYRSLRCTLQVSLVEMAPGGLTAGKLAGEPHETAEEA